MVEVTVIVPVKDDPVRLRRLLEALEAQTLPPNRWEALIVDNGSAQDPAPIVAEFPFARLLCEASPGSYAARNRALADARGALLAFTDSDCLPLPDWLEAAQAHFQSHPETDALGGAIEVIPVSTPPSAGEYHEMVLAFPQEDYVTRLHYGATANMVTRRTVMERIGPFNGALQSSGDEEWGQRLHAAGGNIDYCPQVRIQHPARTASERLQKVRRVAIGKIERRIGQPLVLYLIVKTVWRLVPPLRTWWAIARSPLIPTWRAKLAAAGFQVRLQASQAYRLLWAALGGR